MNSNRMLTLALYLLLGGLVAVFGYRACQLKKEQAAKLAEQAEMEQTLRDMGYQATDADQSGVAKPSDLTDTKTTAPATSTTTTTTTATTPATAAPKVAETTTAETVKPVTHAAESKPVTEKKFIDRDVTPSTKTASKLTQPATKSLTAKGTASKAVAPSKPAYAVIAASFSKKENARKVMEALVKKGFTNAEVSAKGKYWVVISDRAWTKESAATLVDKVNKEPDCAKAYVFKKP